MEQRTGGKQRSDLRVSVFDQVMKVVRNRKHFPSAADIVRTCLGNINNNNKSKTFIDINNIKKIIHVVDILLFPDNSELLTFLSAYKFHVVDEVNQKKKHYNDDNDNLITTYSKHSNHTITMTFHRSLTADDMIDNRQCSENRCFVYAILHEITHVIEFAVRVQLHTLYGYSAEKTDDHSVLFRKWAKNLFDIDVK